MTRPEVLPNRVNVDTGAFLSGRLTALVIDGAEKWVLTVDFEGQRVMAVDAIAVDGMAAGRVGGVDRHTPSGDGEEHEARQQRGSQGIISVSTSCDCLS